MSQNYPNIVPENNLRLPDALTIKHGPAPLIARFVLEGDKFFRDNGIRLRLRHDFPELVYINREEVRRGTWYRLLDIFNPELADLSPENSYWISGEDDKGEIVLTQAGRVYYWPSTTLADEARLMFYGGRDVGQQCRVTAEAAGSITGLVFNGGAHWLRPDFRRRHLSPVIGRIGRAYATSRWPLDWATCFVTPGLIAKGVATQYGYRHVSRSLFFPGSPIGDVEAVVLYSRPPEIYQDLVEFLVGALLEPEEALVVGASSDTFFGETLMSISSDEVFQGKISRS